MRESNGPVILFDGVCNLCNRAVVFVLRRDRGGVFRFASLQSAAGRALLEGAGLAPGSLETMVVVVGGRAYVRSDAAIEIARRLPGGWRLVAALARLVPRPLRDAAYDLVARNRYRLFGRRESCMLPEPGVAERFME